MDELDWRIGKPPVVYCITYGLCIVEENNWLEYEADHIYIKNTLKKGIYIKVIYNGENDSFYSKIEELTTEKDTDEWYNELHKGYNLLIVKEPKLLVIAIEIHRFFYSKGEGVYERFGNCGVLASRLQKCIRRGGGCVSLLEETIRKMRKAPPYNLPELQFLRVNSNRQIFWRLFITTIEDMSPYIRVIDSDYLGINDLVVFSVITSYDADLQMNDALLEKVIRTAKLIQSHDSPSDLFEWRSGNENLKLETLKYLSHSPHNNAIDLRNSLILALSNQNMMSGDRRMIIKILSLLTKSSKNLPFLKDSRLLNRINDPSIIKDVKLSSYDMHCIPNIILILQGSLNWIPVEGINTTQSLSSLIWELSSSYNIRNISHIQKKKTLKDIEIFEILREIQAFYVSAEENNSNKGYMEFDKTRIIADYTIFQQDIIKADAELEYIEGYSISNDVKRIAFLNLFGKKIRFSSNKVKGFKNLEGVFCGDQQHPCKIKTITANKMMYLSEKERFLGEIDFINELSIRNRYFIENPKAPFGFKWIWEETKKKLEIHAELLSSDQDNQINHIKTYIDGIELELFNAEKVLSPINRIKPIIKIPVSLDFLIAKTLFSKEINSKFITYKALNNGYILNLLLRGLAHMRYELKDYRIFDVYKLLRGSGILVKIWKHVLIKIFTGNKDEILIGPVDRSGKKLQNSISYLYEGVIWRIYNLLTLLYPRVIRPVSDLKFKINRNCSEYLHLYELLLQLSKEKIRKEPENAIKVIKPPIQTPQIKSHLWEHQESTSNRIYEGLVINGKKGFGDASCVGSGKTLTALSILQKIIQYKNNKNDANNTYKGFLILLPTQNLFETWTTEIKKHTIGFEALIQESNGKINKDLANISRNTLIITTLGRFRDHPIYISWQLVVIDECLSVQNREALQTEEAWKQVIISEYGVIMMSATFFRSRFDKMFFMLKMLIT